MKSKIQILTFFACLIAVSGYTQKIWNLQNCIDTALKKNISVNQGQLNSNINNTNLKRAKAQLFPNLNIDDAYSLNSGKTLDPYLNQYTHHITSINDIALNSSVTLYNGSLLLNTIRQSNLNYKVGILDVEKLRNDIMINVLAAYMQVLMDYEAVSVAQAQIDATEKQVNQTNKFVEFGKVPEINLIQIQSQLASDQLTKINTENQLQLDKLTLLQLMEIPVRSDFDIQKQDISDLFPAIPMSSEEIMKISVGFLPQIKSAQLRTDASVYSLKMAESGYFPKLIMGASVKSGFTSLNNGPFSTQLNNNFNQTIGLSLSIPIFNNFLVKSNTEIAKINFLNAQLNQQQIKNDVRKSIEIAYTNQVSAGKKLVATRKQMELEKRTYDDLEKKFLVGALDATTFLIEKNNYEKVSMALLQAKYDYVLKVKIVDFYMNKPLTFN
ncbi:MAG: TolC family protein [Bacteroidota bacterium]|nr:TolC family protein [Bacteroidota bacterium]